MKEIWRNGIGQDSHCFVLEDDGEGKRLMLGGVLFPNEPALEGNSDADVVLHALCNAISSVTGVRILGSLADRLCAQGITDSTVYLREALHTLDPAHNPSGRLYELMGIAVSIEAKRPHLAKNIEAMRIRLAQLCKLEVGDVGVTATSGEGLTDFGRGLGVAAIVSVSIREIRE